MLPFRLLVVNHYSSEAQVWCGLMRLRDPHLIGMDVNAALQSTRREGCAAMAACCMSASCHDDYVLLLHLFIICLRSRLLKSVAVLEDI